MSGPALLPLPVGPQQGDAVAEAAVGPLQLPRVRLLRFVVGVGEEALLRKRRS